MVHMTLDEGGGLCGVGRRCDPLAYARHASPPERAVDSRSGKVCSACRLGDFALTAEEEEDGEDDKAYFAVRAKVSDCQRNTPLDEGSPDSGSIPAPSQNCRKRVSSSGPWGTGSCGLIARGNKRL